MKYTVSSKHLSLSDKTLAHIKEHVEKVNRLFPHLASDITELDICMRENKQKKLNRIKLEEGEEKYTGKSGEAVHPKDPNPIYFDGVIKLVLPKKPLVVHFKEATIDGAINVGFERLCKKIKTYKGKHYSGNSEYYDHRSIRKTQE